MHPGTNGPSHHAGGVRYRHAPSLVRRRRVLLVGGLAVLLCLAVLLVLAVSGLRDNLSVEPLRAGTVDRGQETAAATGALNVLVIGSDTRDLGGRDTGDRGRSDALILVHLAEDDSRVDAVQIPRDTLMDLPACRDTGYGASSGGRGMINAALAHGPACSVVAVEELSGVRIDHFVEMDFDGFAEIVDALDGLPVDLPEPMTDPRADLDLPAGAQTVDGRDALALFRTRHAVGDGSDIARLEHQQMLLDALAARVEERHLLTRPDMLYSLLEAVTSAVTVDEHLGSMREMAALGARLGAVDPAEITVTTMPWGAAPSDPNRVVPAEDAQAVFDALAEDRPLPAAA
ncbi:LCP family protein [Brachybacterium sp. YJGR34]|uniref:LCP family protein n=1 Tax=Brachybacterium sp. YJGR34 TaxID=2059911 RepID=UPI000E0B045A|nr:LCP family protein [Brachybacterium sp. YJGR34]